MCLFRLEVFLNLPSVQTYLPWTKVDLYYSRDAKENIMWNKHVLFNSLMLPCKYELLRTIKLLSNSHKSDWKHLLSVADF